jgi:beta-1,4-mannosyl-glycoprotein beta-1,4-N-acetylglucosaminyltransferase
MTSLLDAYQPDDVVILSDADEIPDVAVLREWIPLLRPSCWFGFDTTLSYYYMNLVVPKRWACIAVAQVGTAKAIGMQSLRHLRKHPPMGLKTGGWHFAYLGGVVGVQEKLHASAHMEYDTPQYTDLGLITQRIADKVDFYDPRTPLHEVSIGTLPVTVQRHPDRYAQYLVPSDSRVRVHARPRPGVLVDSVV